MANAFVEMVQDRRDDAIAELKGGRVPEAPPVATQQPTSVAPVPSAYPEPEFPEATDPNQRLAEMSMVVAHNAGKVGPNYLAEFQRTARHVKKYRPGKKPTIWSALADLVEQYAAVVPDAEMDFEVRNARQVLAGRKK